MPGILVKLVTLLSVALAGVQSQQISYQPLDGTSQALFPAAEIAPTCVGFKAASGVNPRLYTADGTYGVEIQGHNSSGHLLYPVLRDGQLVPEFNGHTLKRIAVANSNDTVVVDGCKARCAVKREGKRLALRCIDASLAPKCLSAERMAHQHCARK